MITATYRSRKSKITIITACKIILYYIIYDHFDHVPVCDTSRKKSTSTKSVKTAAASSVPSNEIDGIGICDVFFLFVK